MAGMSKGRRFEIADLVAIVAGFASIGVSLYGAPIRAENADTAPIGLVWAASLAAGVMAILAVFLAQRSRTPARALLAVAGVLALVATLTPGGPWAMLRITHLVIGLAMLGAATSIGRMPVDTRSHVDGNF